MIKVFISSKQGELDPERAALHHAFQSAEWDNFTIEFSGAFPDPVRDVFLKNVAECDVYLGIFASIYSQPTIDEYHKAKALGKPILIYLKKCAKRDALLDDFIRTELQPSHKYQEFSATKELISHLPDIRRALDIEIQKHQRQTYLDALVAQTELLELAGIVDTGEQERLKLQEIFVALSTAEEVEERDKRQLKENRESERPIKITRRVTIEHALRGHRNLMILGDPGSGKSTLLRYVALAFAENESEKYLQIREQAIPILIRLSSFAQAGQSFVEYFETYAEKQLHVSLGKKFFERALEDGQATVCLDGLDEVSQPAQRIDVRNAITALANRYPRNRFIVTSRVAGYDSAPLDKRAFAHHTIAPFGEKEIQSFTEKWYAAREREPEQAKARATSLFNDLKANERLMKLAENPLTLTIIALVHQRAQGKLPDARVELYDRCAETLIEEWDKWKGPAPEDRERPYYRLRRRLLERVAYWMHIESQEQDVAQISARALEMKVAEFLVEDKTLNLSEDTARIEAKQFVALVTSRTGILVEREQGAVSFIHLTFQEYFGASDLYWRYRKTPDTLWQAIQPHLYDSRWLEVILLLLGRLNNDGNTPSIIVGKILCEHDRFDTVLHRNLFLAARCLIARVTLPDTLQSEIVDKLLSYASAKRPKYPGLQSQSIDVLAALRGNTQSSSGLRAVALNEGINAHVRCSIAEALIQLGQTDDAVQSFLALARAQGIDPYARRRAIERLGGVGRSTEAARFLLDLTQDIREYEWVREDALKALEQLARTEELAVEGLLELVNGFHSLKKRIEVAGKLGGLGRKEDATCALLTLAHEVEDEWIRIEVAQALANLGCVEEVKGLLVELLEEDLVGAAAKRIAAKTFGKIGQTDVAVRLLLTMAQDEKAVLDERKEAALALDELGFRKEAARSLLAVALDQGVVSHTRRSAVEKLLEWGRVDDASRSFLALVQDKEVHKDVRCDALIKLAELGPANKVMVQGLLKLAQEKQDDVKVRSLVVYVLGKWGLRENAATQALLLIAQDAQAPREVLYEASKALGELGHKEIETQLILMLVQDGCLNDPERRSAVKRLGKLGNTADAPRLLRELMQNEKAGASTQLDAAVALGELGYKDEAARWLIELAEDTEQYEWDRLDAAKALGQLGYSDKTKQLLLALSQDRHMDSQYKFWSLEALAELGSIREAEFLLLQMAQKRLGTFLGTDVVRALGKLAHIDSNSISVLLMLAWDQNAVWLIRECAARELVGLGRTRDAALLFLTLAQDTRFSENERRIAAARLEDLAKKEPRALLALLELTGSRKSLVRNTAYSALRDAVGNSRWEDVSRQAGELEK